jgi:hypothetical protein
MSYSYGDITIALSNNEKFSNVTSGDFIISTEASTQAIHIGANIGGASTVAIKNQQMVVDGDVLPLTDATYNIGSVDKRVKDIYVGNVADINGTILSNDGFNNLAIIDSDSNLKNIVVNEVLIGDSNVGDIVRLEADAGELLVNNVPVHNVIESAIASAASIATSNLTVSGIMQSTKIRLNSNQTAANTVFAGVKIAYGHGTTDANGFCQVSYSSTGFTGTPQIICTPYQQEGTSVSYSIQVLSGAINSTGNGPTDTSCWILATKNTNNNVVPATNTEFDWFAIGI